MEKTVFVLPDGTELTSGNGGITAIAGVSLTENINEKQELEPGTVAAAVLECDLLLHGQMPPLSAGTQIQVFREEDTGTRRKLGVFISKKPEKKNSQSYRLTACDMVSLLDQDLTGWLAGLEGWPYSLKDFGQMVCHACGGELDFGKGLNGDYPVEKFVAGNVTGRQLLSWVCQAAGTFCRADPAGKLYLDWYEDRGRTLLPTGDTGFYYQNSLSFEDFATAPVDRVVLRQSREDVGVSWPDSPDGKSHFIVTGNPLLTAVDAAALQRVAQSLFERMQSICYTPCKLTVSSAEEMTVGEIFRVTELSGRPITAVVMSRKRTDHRDAVACTGSPYREEKGISSLSYHALTGKVLELTANVDGIRAENRALSGKSAALQLSIEGIEAQTSRQDQSMEGIRQELTNLQQTAQQVKLSVERVTGEGASKVVTATGYTFDQDGLRIQKSGQEMENKLTDTGMYVTRSGYVMLRADKDGVVATDVSVRNYLIIGTHARLEDYSSGTDDRRTACYWI